MQGNIKKLKKAPLSLLLVASMVLSNGSYLIQAKDNTPIVYSQEVSNLTDEQLASLTNPILQQYTADESHKIWRMTSDTRLAILANQENLDNERLAEIVKLVNSEFMEKEIVSSAPFAMVYAQEKDAGYGDVLITIDDVSSITEETTSEEAYKIEIDDNGVRLTGASETAILYGLRTIQNLMITNNGLVYGTIIDYPYIAERRLHVDCARKYISKDWFIRQIREMSYLKMNAIQMHFSENLGFRIECETDPSIVSDQYLTKDEVREILQEAKKYGVKVIPSFDSPGHVDQILRAHPEYGQVNSSGEHFASGLDVTNPEAIAYIRSLYSEYMDLFEGCTDFHIGGDEYMEFDRAPFTTQYKSVLDNYAKANIDPNATWKDVLANYINELAEFVHDRGFTPRIWNDGIYYGENSYYENPQMIKMHDYIGIDFWSQMSWNSSIARLNTFIQKGHDTIYNINASFFYYVLRNSKPTDGREQHSFDNLNADRKIFNEWTPGKFQENTVADDSDFIKGASIAIWCDNPNLVDEDVITDDVSDELRALASKSWNVRSNQITTFEQFQDNYEKLGNVAGFEKQSQLPDSGEFLLAEDLGKVTLKYVSESGKVLKNDVVKYGTVGEDFEFSGDDIYGYRLKSDQAVSGKYTKEGVTFTFVYELYCDKTELANEINNPLLSENYIRETISDYNSLYQTAKEVYLDENSEQLAVDEALADLVSAKNKVVELKYYPLYIEANYPLKDKGYTTGYSQYQSVVANAKNVLYSEDLTVEKMNEALAAIQTAKDGLMLPDGNVPSVSATDDYYSVGVYPSNKYSYDKMLDNDESTKCWFNKAQEVGTEIVFSFTEPVNMSSVRVLTPSDAGGDAIVAADIQISMDNENWTTVGSFDDSKLDNTVSFDQTMVKYVRILLTEAKSNWYQIAEVNFTFEQVPEDNTLRDLIAEAKEIDLEGKDIEAVADFVDALIEAQKVYAENSLETQVVEEALQNAINNLEKEVTVSKTALSIAVEMASNVTEADLENVVPAVVTEFNAALEEARAILANDNATQEEVDASFARLATAMHMLEFLKGDKAELQDLVDSTADLVEGNYTEESWTALQEALTNANTVLNNENAMQEEVDEAYDNLQAAINGLEEAEVVDKSLLEAMVNKVLGLEEDKYIASSWQAMLPELEAAQEVLGNEKATQAEVDEACDALTRAYLNLRLKPNKDLLADLINKTNGLNAASYTAKTWAVVENEVIKAKEVLEDPEASEAEVKAAEKALTKALEGLVAKPGNTVDTSTSVKAGDTTVSVKTGDVTSFAGITTLGASLAALAYLAVTKKKEN
ncbi:family 20 glycosylhydrolase [Thomasclavelia cocleata]|uniref:family 20 glycosylhydrolase n=10 Tax=Thomasclavelia cocleata TaxID=69824 RepID=UPI002573E700|nr:family 20 glycosylhydrolase [Thomasclavelia cocleata]